MQKHYRSIAMIRRFHDERAEWLSLWNSNRKQWEFIIGERLGNESFRETVLREVSWQLKLDRHRDILVSNMSHLNLEYVGCLPGESETQQIALAFFVIELYGKAATTSVSQKSECDWLGSREVCGGRRSDRSLVDPKITEWVNRWGIIQPWQ